MCRNIVTLLGNGFNIGLKEFLKQSGSEREEIVKVVSSLEEIINLWNKFDEILKNVKNKIEHIDTDEQALEYIYTILDFFKFKANLKEHNPLYQCLKELEENLNNDIFSSIKEISYSFFSLEKEGNLYKDLTRILRDFKISINILGDVFTTNYDGIAEILFRLTYNRFGEDLFRGCDPSQKEYVCFNPAVEKESSYLLHLHGSYKIWFLQKQNEFIKIRSQNFQSTDDIKKFLENNNVFPIIIFNAPSRKQYHIDQFFILKTYYKIFGNALQEADILIIWGNSLQNDPHIVDLIKRKYLNGKEKGKKKEKEKEKKVIIIDIKSENILNLLSLKEENFHFINAKEIAFNEIPNEIEKLLEKL